MTAALLGFLCGIFGFGIFLIAQIAIFRLCPEIKRSHVLVRGIAATLAASILTAALPQAPAYAVIVLRETFAIMTVGCLFVLYVPFFYTVHTSLSIESLILLKARGGCVPLTELMARFASLELFEARLRTMVESGYLIQSDEQYTLTPRAQRMALIFGWVKSIWKLGSGG